MKRGGNAQIFLDLIEKARRIVPGIVIRTSFIVGFPGETEADYKELEAFITAAKIDWLGVFTYSDEEGAKAFELADELKVPKRTIQSRRRKLMKLQQKISTKSKAEWVGREIDLLVEGESEETELLWEGRTALHAPEIDGKVFINDFGPHETLVPGTFYRAEITESHDYDVVARILAMKPVSAGLRIFLIIGLSIVLLAGMAPMLLPFAWQLAHDHKAHIQQAELQLKPGWMVFRDSLIKPTQNIFLGNSESDIITLKSIEKCQSLSSASEILARLKRIEGENAASSASEETLNIGGQIASCFTIRPVKASPRDQTSCVAMNGQVVVTILATPEARDEALNMLGTLRATKPCTP